MPIEHSNIAPQDVRDDEVEKQELHIVVKWVVLMLAIFQTRFFLTNRALDWILKFLGTLLTFLGKYSPSIAEIALMLPKSLYKHNISLTDGMQDPMFERCAVCKACESLYKFEDCVHKVGSRIISVNRCPYKPFKKRCNKILMKEVISTSGHRRYYPYKMYCYKSLISSLQDLVMRAGFVQQCESTRNKFSTVGLSDVYDGTIHHT